MKKILLFAFLIVLLVTKNVYSQNVPNIVNSNIKSKIPYTISKQKLREYTRLKPRSFTEDYRINYANYEQARYKDKNLGNFYFSPFVDLNQNFSKVHFGTLKDLLQIVGGNGDLYDILGFSSSSSSYVYRTVELSKTNLILDSFNLSFRHTRVSTTTPDTLIVTVYDRSTITIPNTVVSGTYPNWTSNSITYPSSNLYTQTIILNSQEPYTDTIGTTTPFYFTNKMFKPNLTLPAGKSFALRIQFMGDTANFITPVFNFRDECNNTCLSSPAFNFNTTGFLNQTYNLQDADPTNDIPYNGALNVQGIWFFCQNNEPCEYTQAQNLDVDYFLHSTTDFNVKIDPVSNNRGCSGATLNLVSSYSGMDTNNTVALKWKAVGGGVFENGFDTISGASATYTFDTLGGFKNIILTGTGSNSEVARDTLSVENWSMKPILTTTGKISCSPSDSIRIAIANSAAVGISSNLVTAYDALTNRNLATNLNDLNSYFALTYNWSSPGASPRSDTTFIYTKTAGTYTVTVTNFVGCQKAVSYTAVNSASTPPTLDFTFTPSTVCINKEVTFNVTSAATRANWTYSFKEGSTLIGDGTSVPHTFTSSGTKSVTLTADSVGCTATAVTKPVNVKSATDAACKSSIHESVADNINIYPNPVRNGEVYIKNDLSTPLTVRVTDILGKVIATDKLNPSKTNQLDLTKAPNGVYFIELEGKNDRVVRKIVVDRQ